jgi:glycosyltransferase involved in cell wall biosynthesis
VIPKKKKTTLTIVSPCFNEAQILEKFWLLLSPVVSQLSTELQIKVLFVNNGSTDATLKVLNSIKSKSPEVGFITLSRNFGYQGALDAGIRSCESDLYCIIDADGEDPPELLFEFYKAILNGADLAYGVRKLRHESRFRSNLRKFFYRTVFLIADDPFNIDAGEFSMFTDELKKAALQENNSFPFLRASLARVGFTSIGIPHERNPRLGGTSRFNAIAMANFAVGGALSSSTYPLRLALYLLPLNVAIAMGFLITGVVLQSMVPIQLAIFFLLLIVVVQLSFVSVYLARTYKNGLFRPASFTDFRNSSGSREYL